MPGVRWLHAHLVVQGELDAGLVERVDNSLGGQQLGHVCVGHHKHVLRLEVLEVPADFGSDAGPITHRRRRHLEGVVGIGSRHGRGARRRVP